MPISPQLSHVDAVQAVHLEIERRRLSTEDLYQFALSTMAGKLDTLLAHLTEEPGVPGRYLALPLKGLLDKVSTAVDTSTPRTHSTKDVPATPAADLALVAYGTLRDGIAQFYSGHLGTLHSDQCLICRCLWLCAAVIDATERELTRRMRVAAQSVKSIHSGQPSHKAAPIPVTYNNVQRWRVTCPTCGILETFPINKTGEAARLAIRHRRSGATMSRRLGSTW